ncbi:MAG TPA: MarR family transcriptional regulator [Solirubrobacteraceae bacterium]|nr:MarR family transcriptional regulator [Solirubrobacteraceae bacterium]
MLELETLTTAELAARLRVVVVRTSRRLRQEADTGLSPSLTAALVAIARRGPLTPSELADAERVKRPTATRFVSCLERSGLVTRDPDPDDGRSYRVGITPAGAGLLAAAAGRKNAYLARGLESLDADELATLDRAAALLERLLDEEQR